MGETVRTFVMENGVWVAKRVPKGRRKPEWNNENRKTARKIRARQLNYDEFIKTIKDPRGYHRPGSAG